MKKLTTNWMRKGWMVLGAAMLLFAAGCGKNGSCKNVDPSQEDATMQAFVKSIGMNATKDARGYYYEIIAPGSSTHPKSTSTVYVSYKGTLLDGTVFDQQTNPGSTGFSLNSLIKGWQYGIPLIGKGGSIKLVLPSALSYGCTGSGTTIPADSPLYFEISLADFY
jgi:FKBP-type peptidyl-prolyl cis-trans isomerase FkpA